MEDLRVVILPGVQRLDSSKLSGFSGSLPMKTKARWEIFFPESEGNARLSMSEFIWTDLIDSPGESITEYIRNALKYEGMVYECVDLLRRHFEIVKPDLVIAHSLGSVLSIDYKISQITRGEDRNEFKLLTLGSPLGANWLNGSFLRRNGQLIRMLEEGDLPDGDKFDWVNMASLFDPIASDNFILKAKRMNMEIRKGYKALNVSDRPILDIDDLSIASHAAVWESDHVADEAVSLLSKVLLEKAK